MTHICRPLFILSLLLLSLVCANAQIDDICREAGVVPSLDSPFAKIPYVFGRVTLNAADPAKPARITVIFWDREQNETRWTVGKSGYYCFERNNASGGLLVVEVNGSEAARKTLPSLGPSQQREDFEVLPPELLRASSPGTVSAKFSRPPNAKTTPLYKKVYEAERGKRPAEALNVLQEIVQIDPEDFIAWAKLGTVQFEQGKPIEADAAFRKSLELRVDYTPAWINVAKLRMSQKQYDAAVEILKYAATLEPGNARVYQLLGESYIFEQKGSLGSEALNKAIDLDPIGMAESHLLLAVLYDRAGAKNLASREYRLFLEKVKDHPEKKKFQKYVRENPEK